MKPNFLATALLLAGILLPIAAKASFGGGTPCKDFACQFFIWGLLVGASGGIPTSALMFAVVHLVFCHRARSRVNQFFLGGFAGIMAFGIAAAFAALLGTWNQNPWIGLIAALMAFAIASALYARSSPRPASGRSTA